MHHYFIDHYIDIAKVPVEKYGFLFSPPEEVFIELSLLSERDDSHLETYRDMRDKLWISMDDIETFEIDQLTYAEITPEGVKKIYLAVADVDTNVPIKSAADRFAAHNATSIYSSILTVPMLPIEYSSDITSFKENVDRPALVFEMDVGEKGEISGFNAYTALVRNNARLTFDEVAQWISRKGSLPVEGFNKELIQEQVLLQRELKKLINKSRFQKRVLNLPQNDSYVIVENGALVGFERITHNEAHGIISNYVSSANTALHRFVEQEGIPCLKRVIKKPDRWDLIRELAKEKGEKLPSEPDSEALHDFLMGQHALEPENFISLSLAVAKFVGKGEYIVGNHSENPKENYDYIKRLSVRSSAPNRRFPDLINQRLIKSYLRGIEPSYKIEELEVIGKHCTRREDAAFKVQRHLNKTAFALFLERDIGTDYPAMVTGVNDKATWVKMLVLPYVEGRLVTGHGEAKLGESLRVKLVAVNVSSGQIDFQKI